MKKDDKASQMSVGTTSTVAVANKKPKSDISIVWRGRFKDKNQAKFIEFAASQLCRELAVLGFQQYFEFLQMNHGRFHEFLLAGGNQPRIKSIKTASINENLTALLLDILNGADPNGIIVFVETKRTADLLASFLSESGIATTSVHGDRKPGQRREALDDFFTALIVILRHVKDTAIVYVSERTQYLKVWT